MMLILICMWSHYYFVLVNNPVRCYGILKFLVSIYVNSHVDYNQAKDNQI
jgi:hypothetical protein